MAGKKTRDCDDYITFGTCRWGPAQCKYRHDGKTWSFDYFLGFIDKVTGKRYKIKRYDAENSIETYWVDGKEWCTQNAQHGQLVMFQRSKKEKNDLRCGRVVLVLGQGEKQREVHQEAEIAPEVEVFTLYPTELPVYWNALSITNCDTHGDKCRKIGIHIPAVAWCLSKPITSLPSESLSQVHSVNEILKQRNEGLIEFGCIKMGKPLLAISVYKHSETSDIKGPVFTPARVAQNYNFGEYCEKNRDNLKLLCSIFKTQNPPNILTGKHLWYLTLEKETHMPHIVVDEAVRALTLQVTEYFQQHIGNHCILKFWLSLPSKRKIRELIAGQVSDQSCNEDLLVLEEHLAQARDKGSSVDAAKWLASSLQIMSLRETVEETTKISKQSKDVKKGKEIEDNHFACVLAQKSVSSIINQQILINSMLGASAALYAKEDLIGISVHRFYAPVLVKALIRKFDKNFLFLNYMDLPGLDLTLTKIPYEGVGLGAKVEEVSEGECKLTWENFNCDEVEHDKVSRVEAIEVGKCFSSLRQSADPSAPLAQMTRVELPPPFEVTTSKQLRLMVKPGMVIRMQLCTFHSEHRTQVGLRMLRAGKNGHICLAHMNCPQKVFVYNRKDLLDFATTERLPHLNRIAKIYPAESHRVITWSGRYNAGGKFKTDHDVKKGDLLCIRKDMYDSDRVEYVWNAHAVVTKDKAADGTVAFSVCSLLQPGEMEDSDDFVVEYIDLRHESSA